MSFAPLRSTQLKFILNNFPTVITLDATSITGTQATGNGTVVSAGGSSVTVRGFVWSTNPQPTLADNVVTSGSGTGTYTGTISGLSGGTTYYYRAYATNSIGTGYGDNISFTTVAAANIATRMMMGFGM